MLIPSNAKRRNMPLTFSQLNGIIKICQIIAWFLSLSSQLQKCWNFWEYIDGSVLEQFVVPLLTNSSLDISTKRLPLFSVGQAYDQTVSQRFPIHFICTWIYKMDEIFSIGILNNMGTNNFICNVYTLKIYTLFRKLIFQHDALFVL